MDEPGEARAYRQLRIAILTLDLSPGERLSERALESRLGVSRTPIRAALLRLGGEGLTVRTERGWAVAPLDIAEVRAAMEYREIVEVAAVRLAVDRASDPDLAALRELVDTHRSHDDPETGLRDGGDFHHALAATSGNAFLAAAVADTITRLARVRWLEVRSAASRAYARDEHAAIIDAVAHRDADRAAALTLAHGRGTRDRLLAVLDEERGRRGIRSLAIVDSAAG
ncbi:MULTISPECIES: GntR family transcriptional regulator [Microbacterium]|nr:GntR family transcriptional regulator [Microbacterium sp. 4NA327F11]MCK9913858.1 GntR family transcriptional regulator [Microbacteriaceae bacterium K1510]